MIDLQTITEYKGYLYSAMMAYVRGKNIPMFIIDRYSGTCVIYQSKENTDSLEGVFSDHSVLTCLKWVKERAMRPSVLLVTNSNSSGLDFHIFNITDDNLLEFTLGQL